MAYGLGHTETGKYILLLVNIILYSLQWNLENMECPMSVLHCIQFAEFRIIVRIAVSC